jgi:hypothetical protein
MSYIKFNHVFLGLMALSFLSAFVFPRKITERVQTQVNRFFTPVSWPMSHLAARIERMFPERVRDEGSPGNPRPSDQVYRENSELRQVVASLSGQLERLRQREAEREKLGQISDLCTRFSVAGADPGTRGTILLSGSGVEQLKEGMPVLYSGGVVGRIARDGSGQVQLVTDNGFKALVAIFAQFVNKSNGTTEYQPIGDRVIVRPDGEGAMVVVNSPADAIKAAGLRVGDGVFLDQNRDWPVAMEGARLGSVVSINPSRTGGFVDIKIAPDRELKRLPEVMVMNKEKG